MAQTERSQHQNKQIALTELETRLKVIEVKSSNDCKQIVKTYKTLGEKR